MLPDNPLQSLQLSGAASRPPFLVLGVPLLAAAMTIIYPTSSSTSSSTTSFPSWLSLFSIVDSLLNHHVPHGYVPLYTWLVLLYLSVRYYYYDGTSVLVPETKRKEKVTTRGVVVTPTTVAEPQPIDLSGSYKLVENRNFQQLLQAQGVPWLLVRAADKARPTHKILHIQDELKIQIQGIIESETHYIINGSPVETNIRGRLFRDQVSYLTLKESIMDSACEYGNDNSTSTSPSTIVGIQTHKRAVDDGYTVLVQRRLLVVSDNRKKQQIIMTSRVIFDGDDTNQKMVTCTQIFQRE